MVQAQEVAQALAALFRGEGEHAYLPDDDDVKRFGTRRSATLVIAGVCALIALVGYAGYLVWDRVSMGDAPPIPGMSK